MTDPETLEHVHQFDRRFFHDALKRDILWRLAVAMVLIFMALAVVGWASGMRPGDPAAISGAVAFTVAAPLMSWLALRRLVSRTYAMWERLSPDHIIRYRIGPETIEVEMPNGTSRYLWKDMRRLWCYRDIWLLEIVKNIDVLFPADAPSPIRDYILARCRSAGVRVSGNPGR
jgi:hypothetical protein